MSPSFGIKHIVTQPALPVQVAVLGDLRRRCSAVQRSPGKSGSVPETSVRRVSSAGPSAAAPLITACYWGGMLRRPKRHAMGYENKHNWRNSGGHVAKTAPKLHSAPVYNGRTWLSRRGQRHIKRGNFRLSFNLASHRRSVTAVRALGRREREGRQRAETVFCSPV